MRRDRKRTEHITAIRRYYDTVRVYGDPNIYDPRCEYRFPADIVEKMRPLGCLNGCDRARHVNAAAQAQIQQLGLPGFDQAGPEESYLSSEHPRRFADRPPYVCGGPATSTDASAG